MLKKACIYRLFLMLMSLRYFLTVSLRIWYNVLLYCVLNQLVLMSDGGAYEGFG